MRCPRLIAPLLVVVSLPVAAEDCSEIVAATVAEMRAGESAWDDRAEAIARRAAGAACVKTYSTTAEIADDPVAEAAAAGIAEPVETAMAEEEIDDANAGWKFLGFDVNKVEGSASQKPYARKR